ncbi:MAG: glutamate formimidoyltransferase [Candidatus Bipolaricaulia bacterium]
MIECVPNLSEGRDENTVGQIADAVRGAGCRVLDTHTDPDHHRSVLTIVGEPPDVVRGVLAMVEAAIQRIDVRTHRGAHPRMGAVDVVPFVPLEGSSMAECIAVAEEVGRKIGDQFEIPVYMYEEAASREDRRNLASVRRGGLSAIAERIDTDEGRPDFGPARVHPSAGAAAVGARGFLVAYNVNLATADVEVAGAIASAIRASNGGLPGVKALGILLRSRGIAQVSMNLTDIEATTVAEAFECVANEAERRGVSVLESEIVGLVPRAALGEATTEDLLLARTLADLILERRIEAG